LAVSMGNQNKRTVDIGQTNQIAEWRESNNAWSAATTSPFSQRGAAGKGSLSP
jgi:hypothetical protein